MPASGREKGISRQGDIRLRKLFALGASTTMRSARSRSDRATAWAGDPGAAADQEPAPGLDPGVAVLAQAAKTARIAWALVISGESYRRPAAPVAP